MKLRRLLALFLVLLMAMTSGMTIAESTIVEDPQSLYDEEITHLKYIMNRPLAYEAQVFDQYYRLGGSTLRNVLLRDQTPDMLVDSLVELKGLREQLVSVVEDPEETCWYIWGDSMPEAADSGEYDYTKAWDSKGFVPFLVPYLLEDQSSAKGNLIVIAGGGFTMRTNDYEAYDVAKCFNALGYNAYVLQRRVAPSAEVDAVLDLQRSIRYLKYNAEALGIGAIENIAAVGFSGGSRTIQRQFENHYGDILPTVIYPEYVPDEIDKVNSDIDVAVMVYGFEELVTENANIPAVFMVVGQDDDEVAHKALEFYKSVHELVPTELHILADAYHGFGVGVGFNVETRRYEETVNALSWPNQADVFLQIQFGLIDQFVALGY